MNGQQKKLVALRDALNNLDLEPIKVKLMDREEGHGWSKEHCDKVEVEYKRFLYLVAKYPESVITPDKNTDKFWHAHILDTLKYAEDCNTVFGYFLHHFPYFGMRGEEDAANLAEAARMTRERYQAEFCNSDQASTAYCGAPTMTTQASYCGTAADAAETAYCGAPSITDQTAYCGAAFNAESPAYCGAAPISAEEPAYCGAPNVTGQRAYCGAAIQSAYCGSAMASDENIKRSVPTGRGKAMSVLNIDRRPTAG